MTRFEPVVLYPPPLELKARSRQRRANVAWWALAWVCFAVAAGIAVSMAVGL